MIIKNSVKLFVVFSFTLTLFISSAFAQDTDERAELLAKAQEPF